MKGLRTFVRDARRALAKGDIRGADALLETIDRGLDLDHMLHQTKKAERHARNQRNDRQKQTEPRGRT